MTYIMVDVEADGPIPGDYSMVCFGAIVVKPSLDRAFYGRLKPISEKWIPDISPLTGHFSVTAFSASLGAILDLLPNPSPFLSPLERSATCWTDLLGKIGLYVNHLVSAMLDA